MDSDTLVKTNNFKSSITAKIITIGFLIVILLIPTIMISTLIYEREQRKAEAVNEINKKWGTAQTIIGPVLTVPYRTYVYKGEKRICTGKQNAYFLPEQLSINGTVLPEIRYRGIYEAILYNSRLTTTASFKKPNFSNLKIPSRNVCWDEAFITFGVTDMRGIKEQIQITWNGDALNPESGSKISSIIKSGVSCLIKLSEATDTSAEFTFKTTLDLNGSENLNFIPVGKTTKVKLKSDWPSPSFTGSFLPEKREITKSGFSSEWNILNYNRAFPQSWTKDDYDMQKYSFGVNLILPIDEYQKISRTNKYAILFIALSFLAFFLVEILNKKIVHPIQYLLVGLALCLFYTLLLSLTEHFNFNIAYSCSSVGVILMIFLYSTPVLKSKKFSFFITILISILYGFLFIILQQEDYALLLGSVGLFAILAIVMFLTRKIDWYSIGSKRNSYDTIE